MTLAELQARNEALERELEQCRSELQREREANFICHATLENILDNAIAAICSFRLFANRDWQLDYYSAGCEAVFGYTATELMADKHLWRSRVFPEDLKTVIRPSFEAFMAGHRGQLEYRFYHKDGSLRWISETYASQWLEAANCWVVTLVDTDITERVRLETERGQNITDRKQLEQALKASEAKLNDVLNSAIAAIGSTRVFANGHWEAEYYSAGCESLLGYTSQELINDSNLWFSRVHPEDLQTVIIPSFEAIRAERTIAYEYRFFHKNGTARWIYCTQSSRWNAAINGWIVTIVGIDSTDRKQLEQALQASEAKLSDVLGSAIAAIESMRVFADGTWEYGYVSSGCATVFGYTADEFLANPHLWQARVPPEDLPSVDLTQRLEDIFAERSFQAEHRFYHKDGSLRWLEVTVNSRRDNTTDHWIVTTVTTDISERKQLETERATAEANLRRQHQREQLLSRVTQAIRQSLDLNTIFATSTTELAQTLGVEQVDLVQYCPTENCWRIVANHRQNADLPDLLGFEIPDAGNPIAEQLKRLELVQVSDTDTITYAAERGLAQTLPGAWLVVPLAGTEAVWGNIGIRTLQKPFIWAEEQITFAQTIAQQLEIAIQQASLFHQVQQLNQTLEQRVQERTAQLQLALTATRMGTWEWDPATNRERWSPECFDLLGFGCDAEGRVLDQTGVELSPYPTRELFVSRVHPEDRERFNLAHRQALKQRSPYECEFRIIYQDASVHWIYARGAYIYGEQGQPIRLIGICMDISDRKRIEAERQQAEAALRESEERLRLALEAANMGAWEADLLTGQETWFTQTEALFGMKPGTFDGSIEGFFACIHPEDRDRMRQVNKEAVQTGEFQAEYRIVLRNQTIRWIATRAKVLYDEAGVPMKLTGIDLDITKRKQLDAERQRVADQLRKSLQEKEVLLKEIHHRVKNNLQIVASLLNLQSSCIEDPQILQPFIESQHRIEVMAMIHERLYRSENFDTFNFADYIQSLVQDVFESQLLISSTIHWRVNVEALDLELDLAIPCGLIINELISNAIKYAFPNGQPGEIAIAFRREGSKRILTIQDNGIGFPQDIDFRNTESLGMQVVCALTRQLKGAIALHRNGGTTFEIVF